MTPDAARLDPLAMTIDTNRARIVDCTEALARLLDYESSSETLDSLEGSSPFLGLNLMQVARMDTNPGSLIILDRHFRPVAETCNMTRSIDGSLLQVDMQPIKGSGEAHGDLTILKDTGTVQFASPSLHWLCETGQVADLRACIIPEDRSVFDALLQQHAQRLPGSVVLRVLYPTGSIMELAWNTNSVATGLTGEVTLLTPVPRMRRIALPMLALTGCAEVRDTDTILLPAGFDPLYFVTQLKASLEASWHDGQIEARTAGQQGKGLHFSLPGVRPTIDEISTMMTPGRPRFTPHGLWLRSLVDYSEARGCHIEIGVDASRSLQLKLRHA